MLWIVFIGLIAVWVVGSVLVNSLSGAAAILAAMAVVVAGICFWERRRSF